MGREISQGAREVRVELISAKAKGGPFGARDALPEAVDAGARAKGDYIEAEAPFTLTFMGTGRGRGRPEGGEQQEGKAEGRGGGGAGGRGGRERARAAAGRARRIGRGWGEVSSMSLASHGMGGGAAPSIWT